MADDELDLDAIEQEHAVTAQGEWTLVLSQGECGLYYNMNKCPRGFIGPSEYDDKCMDCKEWIYSDGAFIDGATLIDCGDYDGYIDADMRFCVHAHQYVPMLIAEIRRLRATLTDAVELIEESQNYISEYFYEKWDYRGQIAALKAVLEGTE